MNNREPYAVEMHGQAGTLEAEVSLFSSAMAAAPEPLALWRVMMRLCEGYWAPRIEQVRTILAQQGEAAFREAKKTLPAFTVSALLEKRKLVPGDRVLHTGWLQADFDAKDNPGLQQADLRTALKSDRYVGAVFVGPSGRGIKALVRIDGTRHAASFAAAARHFRDVHGLVIDQSGKDVNRLCFVSYDPDAWDRLNDNAPEDAAVLPIPDEPLPAAPQRSFDPPERPSPAPAKGGLSPRMHTLASVREVLSHLPKRPEYDTWLRIVSGVCSVLPMAEAIAVLEEWSPPEKPGEYDDKWRHRLERVTFATVVHMAKEHGFDARAAYQRDRWMGTIRLFSKESVAGTKGDAIEETTDPDPNDSSAVVDRRDVWKAFLTNHYGDAVLFQRFRGGSWRFDTTAGGWRHYQADTGLWERDEADSAMIYAREVVMEPFEELLKSVEEEMAKARSDKEKKSLQDTIEKILGRLSKLNTAGWLSSVMAIARRLPGFTCKTTDFDRTPHLLAVRNGVLDFKLGRLVLFSPEHKLSRAAPVEFVEGAQCPLFSAFLLERMDGDREMVAYLWRVIGYCLTGFTNHDVIFYCYGTGANGKTTFIKIIQALLGENLSMAIDVKLLLGGQHDGSADYKIALLEGMRLVTATEPEEKRGLNTSMIKRLTGDGKITARQIFEKPHSFEPTHKILMAANHRLPINESDHGTWRRVHLIPWTKTIEESQQRDRDEIVELYCTELPGILNAAIAGYADFLARGKKLAPPECVVAATNAYRREMDSLGTFLAECVTSDPGSSIKLTDLVKTFGEWGEANNEPGTKMPAKALATKLRERGFTVEPCGKGGWSRLQAHALVRDEPQLKLMTGDSTSYQSPHPHPHPEGHPSSPAAGPDRILQFSG